VIEHPNESKDESSEEEEHDPNEPASWAKSKFVRWFNKFDENSLKPFFIFNYNKARILLEDEYQELLKQKVEGDDIVDKVEALIQSNRDHAKFEFKSKPRALTELRRSNQQSEKLLNINESSFE